MVTDTTPIMIHQSPAGLKVIMDNCHKKEEMNSDDKIIYESAKEVIEAIISEIRAAKLDPISLGFPYYTQQHLDTILNTVDVDDYLIHFAMRILEERDWRDKERA